MVFYSKRSQRDFVRIFKGLLKWGTKNRQMRMTCKEVVNYRNDLYNKIQLIADKKIHKKTIYEEHRKFGNFVYSYRRNQRTVWYFIYDIKQNGDILIKKIISNYLTIK